MAEILTKLIEAGIATHNLLACQTYVQRYTQLHRDDPVTRPALVEEAVCQMVRLQAACSHDALMRTLAEAVERDCTDETVLQQLAAAYDDHVS